MSRTERPEQVQAPALRSIIKMIDRAIENGSLNPQDRDEVIQMFISGPTTVVDNKAGGGMMNMNDMIRPIGMAAGGPIPPEEPKIKPKEKPVNFKALMAEFNTLENKAGPGEPVGIEKIIADEFPVDPRFTIKQKIKEMLGMGGGGGSLGDSVMELDTLVKILELEGVLSLEDSESLRKMSPSEINKLYIKTFGKGT